MSRFGDKYRTGPNKGKLKPLADVPDVIPNAPFKSYRDEGFGTMGSYCIPPHGRSVCTRTTNKLNDAMKQLATAEEWGVVQLATNDHVLSVEIRGLTVHFSSADHKDEMWLKIIRFATSKGEKVFPNTKEGAKEAAGYLHYLLSDPERAKGENDAATVRRAKYEEEMAEKIAAAWEEITAELNQEVEQSENVTSWPIPQTEDELVPF